MTFVQAVQVCLRKYVDFNGRASRPEFWWFFLFQLLVTLVIGMLGSQTLSGLVGLALLLPSLAVGARRLHDTGKSAWWLLLSLIVIGFLVLIFFWVQPTKPEGNAFGVAPA
jgi:uncharacterized membrane protein YhaH (DUF805 family)